MRSKIRVFRKAWYPHHNDYHPIYRWCVSVDGDVVGTHYDWVYAMEEVRDIREMEAALHGLG